MRIKNFRLFEGSDNTFPIDDIKTLFGDFSINWRDSQEFKMGVFVHRGITSPPSEDIHNQFTFVESHAGYNIEDTFDWKRKVVDFGSTHKPRTTACKIFFMIRGGKIERTAFNEICDVGYSDSSFLDEYQEVAESLDRLSEMGLKYFISHTLLGASGSFEITIYQPFK